jgi:phage protein D
MPDDQSTGLVSSRPTVHVGGEEIPKLRTDLNSLLIAENTSGLYRCEASFCNWGEVNQSADFLYFDRRTLDFGKTLEIKRGDSTLFNGKIMALEAHYPPQQTPQISVLAEDRFQDLRMTRRTRTFENVTDSDVFNQIANDHGLSPTVDVNGPTYKVLAQVNQSDLAFMRERARTIDAELWMSGNTLNARTRSNRNGGNLQLTRGSDLREFRVLADLATQRTSVTVNGWDVSGKTGLQFEATASAISSELNGDSSGISILQSAVGRRKEALVHTVPLNSQEAQAVAESYFKMSARRFVVGRGIAETSGSLRAGAKVELLNLGPLFSGKYYVTEVVHLFDSRKGLRTEFCAERPGIGSS